MLTAVTLVLSACTGPSDNSRTETTLSSVAVTEATTAAEPETEPEREVEMIPTEQLASSLKEKYAEQEDYIYLKPEYNLPRNHHFTGIDIEFNPVELGHESITEIIGVYADADFSHRVNISFDIEETGEKQYSITIKPGQTGALAVSTTMFEDGKTISLGDRNHINQQEAYEDWGNLGQYYMVQWVDLATGVKLDKPLVKIFTIETELATPEAVYTVTEDGSPQFSWQKVSEAETYYILEIKSFQGTITNAYAIGRTEESSWSPENDDINTMNKMFHRYKASEETEELYDYYYAVIAAGDKGTSSVSKLFAEQEIISRLPYQLALDLMREEDVKKNWSESIGLMPAQIPVIMCDDSIVRRTIAYEMDKADIKTEVMASYDLDENGEMINLENETVRVLYVPYTLEGTTFRQTMKIINFDENTYKSELRSIRVRQILLKGRSGSDNNLQVEGTDSVSEQGSDEVAVIEDPVFATSALGEYLARNMLDGSAFISLRNFPESSDREFLIDAWAEAIYQNPLILSVEGAQLTPGNEYLLVQYGDDRKTMYAKQNEIRNEVANIIEEIIRPDMTDLEKEIAINNYLCDSAEYDYDALENAEKNNFKTVDPEFNDAFTPYGTLINKVGVCASYAGSFKLLADAAGLESIVVTGYLEGTLPHAWNRVLIDGEWVTIDSTNNDNPLLFNAILNLPDDAAGLLLIEDDRYMADRFLSKYQAADGENEYYRVMDQFYSVEEIAAELVSELEANGVTTLRTDYELDDDQFDEIAQLVMTKMDLDRIYGFHWMGVITMAVDVEGLMGE